MGKRRKADAAWLERSLECFRPRTKPPVFEWIKRMVRLPPENKPWNPLAYPHLHAPGGPIEAFERQDVRAVWLQFGSRLGKTAVALACLQYQAANDPCPMLFGSASEDLVRRIIRTKVYPSLEACPELRGQLRAPGRRKETLVELRHCRIYSAWAGSPSQLADLSAMVGHANEIDKWKGVSNVEADPFELFRERLKDHPMRKLIAESTPTIAGRSRIERGMAGSTSRRYWVPCPHCGEFQTIDFGDGNTTWGIKWTPGLTDPEAIKRSAAYVCKHCEQPVPEELRPPMMWSGLWVPEGQTVDRDGSLVGAALRTGGDEGLQLSSFYALNLSWGDAAAAFWAAKDNPTSLQNFRNSWEGRTWSEDCGTTTEAELADRLCSSRMVGVVPDEAIFLTVGVDVQETHLVYVVVAWGLEARGWVVRWGFASSYDELAATVLDVSYLDAAKRLRHRPAIAAIDSGAFTSDVYKFVKARAEKTPRTYASKGADEWLATPYHVSKLKPDGFPLLRVNTNFFQVLVQKAFTRLRPGDPGSLELPADARHDEDFLAQLLNEGPTDKIDKRNYTKRVWEKRDASKPNDFRDALRYARCTAELYVQGAWPRLTPEHRRLNTEPVGGVELVAPSKPKATSPRPGGFHTPDGRPYLVSDRRR